MFFNHILSFKPIPQTLNIFLWNQFQKLSNFGLIELLQNGLHIDDFSKIIEVKHFGRKVDGFALVVEVEIVGIQHDFFGVVHGVELDIGGLDQLF